MQDNVRLPSKKEILGICNFFDDYIHLAQNDRLIICFRPETKLAATWLIYELENRQNNYQLYHFDHHNLEKFQSDLMPLIKNSQGLKAEGRSIILMCEDEILLFSRFLKTLHVADDDVVVWRIMNAKPELFEMALQPTCEELKYLNAELLNNFLSVQSETIIIKSANGTNLKLTLDNKKFNWISNYGAPEKDELLTLPAGEICTYPKSISGIFIADGALHANIDIPFDPRLAKNPVTLTIKNNKIENIACDNLIIFNYFCHLLEQPHMNQVGELGFGTNFGINKFVRTNSHINERHPGMHIACGMALQPPEKIGYKCEVHFDFISPECEIFFPNGEVLSLAKLKASGKEHPKNLSSVDVEDIKL